MVDEKLLSGQVQHTISALLAHGLLPTKLVDGALLWEVVRAQLKQVNLEGARNATPDHCDPSCTSYDLAAMVMSDCGHSTNNQRLLDRIAARLDKHVEKVLSSLPPRQVPDSIEPESWYESSEQRLSEQRYCDGWNACRTAMLACAAPLTGGDERRHVICTCPDCVKPMPTTLQTLHNFVHRVKSLLPEARVEIHCTDAGTLLVGVYYYGGNVRHGYQVGFTTHELIESISEIRFWAQLEQLGQQLGSDR